MADLPVLRAHLQKVQAAAKAAPQVAAGAMQPIVAEGQQRQQAPSGEAFAKVKRYRGNRTGRFDPNQHIAGSYRPLVEGDEAKVVSDHRAARFARRGTVHQEPRPLVPRDDDAQKRDAKGRFVAHSVSVGWWLPKLTEALRRLFSA